MILINYPSTEFKTDENGFLDKIWQNYFSVNTQRIQQYFAQEGHLTPLRTDTDIKALNKNVNSEVVYTGRYVYNTTTDNAMTNIEGTYQNIVTFLILTDPEYAAYTPPVDRLEIIVKQSDNSVHVGVGGTLRQMTLT